MIYFYHIRKTGGRSFVRGYLSQFARPLAELWGMCHSGKGPIHNINEHIKVASWCLRPEPVDFAWSHGTIQSVQLPHNMDVYTVTILRDPVARFVSMYRNILRTWGHNQLTFEFKPYINDDIAKMARVLPLNKRFEILTTFSSTQNLDEALENLFGLSYFLRIENYAQDLEMFNLLTGLNIPVHHFRETRNDEGINKEMHKRLSRKVLKELVEIFEPEYAFLNYVGYERPTDFAIVAGRIKEVFYE